eukprot:11206234-Lingulodinium_polyedra.AAC.1
MPCYTIVPRAMPRRAKTRRDPPAIRFTMSAFHCCAAHCTICARRELTAIWWSARETRRLRNVQRCNPGI